MTWESIFYSAAGFVIGVIMGLIIGPYLSIGDNRSVRLWHREPKGTKVTKADDDEPRVDLSRRLTVMIFIMMIITVLAVARDQYQQDQERNARRAAIQSQLDQNNVTAQQAKRAARLAQAEALRTERDEQLLSQLVVSISQATTPQEAAKAIHTFIRKTRKLDSHPIFPQSSNTAPGPTPSATIPASAPSSHPQPGPVRSTHPPPQPTRHPSPSPHPTRHPSPPPVLPPVVKSIVPSPLCSINIGNKNLC